MSLKVVFTDGSIVEYEEGFVISESPDGILKFVQDKAGNTIATIPTADYKGVMP